MKNYSISLQDELYYQREKTINELLEDKTWFKQIKTDIFMREFWAELVI